MNRRVLLLFVPVALAVVAFPALVALSVDWFWFRSVGYEPVFVKSLVTRAGVGLFVAAATFGFIFTNLRYAQRGVVPHPIVFSIQAGAPSLDVFRMLRRLVWPAALIIAVLFGLGASTSWLTVLSFLHGVPFGVTDPIFHRDLEYYFFTLPVASLGLGLLSGVTTLTLIGSVLLYVLRGDVIARKRVSIEPSAQMHLAILVALLFLTTAATLVFVRLPSLLYASSEARFLGASYADISVRLPMLHVSAAVAVLGAVAVLLGAYQRRLPRNLLFAVGAYVVVALATSAAATAVHRFSVLPNELARETPQLRHHIAATRRAWGLDSVLVQDLTGEAQLTLADIRANSGTIKNVRLWDRDPLLQTFGQLQEIRTYYDFVSVDDDRYQIDGEYRQVLLSPRELNTNSLPTRNFINERLTFTHGMGLTLSPVNQVTDEGLPVLFIKDLPPASSVSLNVKRPAIYFGELSSDYVFVNTGQPEFDYPSGEDNAVTTYSGSGGVPLSLFRRALFSVHFGSMKILLSNDITNDSRVLYHRNIRERASKALPFLRWDADPYMVIRTDGRLQWILDAYTASSRYPYAQRISANGINYLRNSVKVVIDAYDGTIEAYIADAKDPMIATYAAAFPGIFRPLADMAEDLRAHIRYPEDLFRAQTALYATYHMSEPEVFFHREDQWQIPQQPDDRGGEGREPFLRHIIMKLPGEQREEYIEMVPFTPRQKDNLAAWMVARNDGAHYGKLSVYRFPRQSLVYGPTQVLNRINQNPEIARQISLWDQRGSQVIRGNLLVIPIEASLIFVQALYLRAEGGRIPELQRVIVAYRNQVVMEETLEAALANLFGGAAGTTQPVRQPTPAPVAGTPTADLVRQAADHYERAIAAQRVGDWATYGAEIARVGELLRRLNAGR